MCMTQSNTKQLPTCSNPHILIPSVIPFIDMRGKFLSLCCSASPTKQWCKSSIDYLSFFLNWGLQSNYQDNQICVWVWVSQCHWHVTFLQEQILVIHTSGHQKGHSQKHWKCFFCIHLLNILSQMSLFQFLWCDERTHWYGTREIIKETSAVSINEFRPSSIHVSYKIVVSWGVTSNKVYP